MGEKRSDSTQSERFVSKVSIGRLTDESVFNYQYWTSLVLPLSPVWSHFFSKAKSHIANPLSLLQECFGGNVDPFTEDVVRHPRDVAHSLPFVALVVV